MSYYPEKLRMLMEALEEIAARTKDPLAIELTKKKPKKNPLDYFDRPLRTCELAERMGVSVDYARSLIAELRLEKKLYLERYENTFVFYAVGDHIDAERPMGINKRNKLEAAQRKKEKTQEEKRASAWNSMMKESLFK